MTFGERLRELRKARKVSQRELAARVEVDFTYISKIESGSLPPPSAVIIHRIAQSLGADEDELFALAGKIPDGLKRAVKENPLLAELVRVLSERVLPEHVYQQLLTLARTD